MDNFVKLPSNSFSTSFRLVFFSSRKIRQGKMCAQNFNKYWLNVRNCLEYFTVNLRRHYAILFYSITNMASSFSVWPRDGSRCNIIKLSTKACIRVGNYLTARHRVTSKFRCRNVLYGGRRTIRHGLTATCHRTSNNLMVNSKGIRGWATEFILMINCTWHQRLSNDTI